MHLCFFGAIFQLAGLN